MDWLRGMNNVIDYIEENLTQPIKNNSEVKGFTAAGPFIFRAKLICGIIALNDILIQKMYI